MKAVLRYTMLPAVVLVVVVLIALAARVSD